MKKQILVIGGGASGMMAAIQAARNGGKVTILEHMDRVGKKLLSTGNGRCNLTNRYQAEECYRCGQKGFTSKALEQFSMEDTLSFFEELGIILKDRNGYIYPNSDQASSVLDVLRMELDHQKVQVLLNCQIESVRFSDSFFVQTNMGQLEGDALILAAGSKAAKVTGSDGSGYALAQSLGHKIVTPLPALVQLRCRENHYRQLAGIRTESHVSLMAQKPVDISSQQPKERKNSWEVLAEDRGELQLTDYGLSGIPVFQISRYAAVSLHKGYHVKARIDFLPQMTLQETEELVDRRKRQMEYKTCEQWMTGLFNKKLGLVLLKLAGIEAGRKVSQVPASRWKQLIEQIKRYETEIVSVNSFEHAQVCCGGVDTKEVHAETMESQKIPGLYFAGEILDVDGICGGYNLQWAWSSGAVAGRYAATVPRQEKKQAQKRLREDIPHKRREP